jgi:tetratricopeptide (TPR) repeat protein
MHLETIPLTTHYDSLSLTDFVVFSSSYFEVVCTEIPTAQSVQFLNRSSFCSMPSSMGAKEREKWFDRVQARNIPEAINEQSLLFPIPLKGSDPLVAFVPDVDQTIVKRMSSDWLTGCASSLVEQFLKIKNTRLDPVTNIYNSMLLSEMLGEVDEKMKYQVVIIEMRPQARLPKDVLNHVRHATRSLIEFNRFGFPLFYLDHSVFGFLIPHKESEFLKTFCLSLITFMKSKGFKRIHCGSSKALDENIKGNHPPKTGLLILDQAWTALHTACRRGPFAFCDYEVLAYPDHFPLNRLSRSTVSKLQRRWRPSVNHSLIYFVPDYQKPMQMADVVVRFFGQHNYVMSEKGFFVIRRNASAEESKQWAQSIIRKLIEESGDGFSLSAGVSEYPFQRYSKTEIIRNCQKAIMHGEFFGYRSVVIFDAVSLNISGDIYYGEGDLSGAVREYRLGLDLEPDNINLLNSLGVTYALMNRTAEAQQAFQNVLDQEPSNFMALYNRGLGEQAHGNHGKAVHYYLRAFDAFHQDDTDDLNVLNDLSYQLGTAYFNNQEFGKSIEWLERWYNKQDEARGRGKCCRAIGISYFRLSRPFEAMTWLQRALAFDEDDAEALSILGELYLVEREGNDIALKLMEKSLELDNNNRQFMLRLARGLNACDRYNEAVPILKNCIKSSKFRSAAWFELSVSFKGLKKYTKVRYYLKKLIDGEHISGDMKTKARLFYSEISAGQI